MATISDWRVNKWLTSEINDEYKEDELVRRMIDILIRFRNTEERLLSLHLKVSRAQIGEARSKQETRELQKQEHEWLRQLAGNLRILLAMLRHDERFEEEFMKTRTPHGYYNAYPAQRGLR